MKSQKDGVYVPRRLIFILIFISLFVNIFFLLMGILIGKEDLKWSKEVAQEPTEEVGETNPTSSTEGLERDLAAFESERQIERSEPIAVDYLDPDTGAVSSKPSASQPAPVSREPEPTRTPTTTDQRPQTRPVEPAPTQSGFWIQVSATTDKAKAQRFASEIGAKGYPVALIFEGKYHKVQVGPYANRNRANQVNNELSKAFKVKGWVKEK